MSVSVTCPTCNGRVNLRTNRCGCDDAARQEDRVSDGIDRLRRLAEEATPGRWKPRQPDGDCWFVWRDNDDPGYQAVAECVVSDGYDLDAEGADAAYIAAMNPDVARALLDVVAAARDAEEWVPGFDLSDALNRLDALLGDQP